MSDCKTIVQDCEPIKTVVNSCGEPGPEGPQGPSGDITTNESSVTDAGIPVWDGTLGNLLADSGVTLAELVLASDLTTALALKVDKVSGKGLSQEDFTTALKDKLNALSAGTYKGTYSTLVALQANVPVGTAGDYAYVSTAGNPLTVYQWDDTDSSWVLDVGTQLTGAEIKTLLFAEADTNNLTDALLLKLNNAADQSAIDAALAAATALIDASVNNVIEEATTSRTLATGDLGKYFRLTNASGCTLTLNDDATAGWTTNEQIQFGIETATLPTITLGGGVTLLGSAKLATLSQYDVFFIKRVASDTWQLWAG
jgi:hypothetical protein